MTTTPEIVERPAQPYVSIRRLVTMAGLGQLAPLVGDVFAWLEANELPPTGPPFWRYDVIDMDGDLDVEVGLPIAGRVDGDDRISAGVLPAGRYVTVVHDGHPATLEQATRELLQWADDHGVSWDVSIADDGEHWAARIEEYLTDPEVEPNPDNWQTRLAFKMS